MADTKSFWPTQEDERMPDGKREFIKAEAEPIYEGGGGELKLQLVHLMGVKILTRSLENKVLSNFSSLFCVPLMLSWIHCISTADRDVIRSLITTMLL